MGLHEGTRIWKKGAEAEVVRGDMAEKTFSDLVEKSRVQAARYAQAKENAPRVKTFISAGHRDTILESKNPLNAAKFVARNEPHFVPDTIEDLDSQAAYLVALAEEVNKPEYNQ